METVKAKEKAKGAVKTMGIATVKEKRVAPLAESLRGSWSEKSKTKKVNGNLNLKLNLSTTHHQNAKTLWNALIAKKWI